MTSDDSSLTRRPRWYAATIVGAILLVAVFSTAAALVDDDLADGVFGFFTGMIAAVGIALVLWTEIVRKRLALRRDAAALDDLEPLRAATESDQPSPDRPSAGQAATESRTDRPADR